LACFAGHPAWADNICAESVPSNRMVDGIPAYNQCDGASGGPIYSNNGVDTAIASAGTGWVRTQMNGGYQCTELAHRYLYFRWNIKTVPNGNAGVWCDAILPAGLGKSTTPVHGDLIVFAPGSCGADGTTGHVAVVDVVNSNSTVTFVEQNRAGRRSCAITTAACFLHVAANDGSNADGGVPDSAVSDAAPDTSFDARAPREAAADRTRADTPGAAGAGGTVAPGGTTAGGGRIGGSVSSSSTGGQGGALTSSSAPQGGGTLAETSHTGSSAGTTATASATGGDTTPTTSNSGDTSSGGCSCRLGSLGGHLGGFKLVLLACALAFWRRRSRR
jgi:surface antigen